MRMAAVWMIVLLALAVHDTATAQSRLPDSEPTLCDEGEDVYFSCPLENGKTVSVCAKGNTSPARGYVSYRYGTAGDVFAFPSEHVPPAKLAGITDVSEGSIRGLHLKFAKGPYTYIVSSVSPGGVYVLKHDTVVFDQACRASADKHFANAVFDGIDPAPLTKADRH
ncbi:hypothetical protein Bpla01_25080 [Burkholderia plantarii]|uniref:Lipoprotein n=2 Tax=Burkholderia plantarii TaxID=41899 RepID=A0A0B6S1H5_BURPL|nr:hypothetical protein BGL_2c01480 [Burkholderia plantarii]ALK32430.1 hypothetical protein bpln_2g01460 [Burkholderia plantarii]GLZ18978.1 hypothetical protein Bpla01_25080 [Burkholderia plantarii]